MKSFDFDTLTLGEVSTIEDLSGLSISAIADEEQPKGKALAAIAMVITRRNGNPAFTFNQALALPLSDANALISGGTEDDAEGEDERSDESATE